MEFGDYITEKMAAARLGDLRAQSARVALLNQVRGSRIGMLPRLGIALTRVGRWFTRGRGPVRNAGVRVARVR